MKLKRLLTLVAMICLLHPVMAQEKAVTSADIERLTKEMYHLFPTDSVDRFIAVTDQLKAAGRKVGDERAFYKAWANQALYCFSKVGRDDGLAKVREMRDYAEEHDSKFGIYSSSYANAGMLSTLRMVEPAMQAYQEAIDYQHRFFPDESAAAPYLGMAKIYINQNNPDKVRECAQKALAEPGVIMQHQLSAWSYLCMSYTDKEGNVNLVDDFNRCYAERQKVKEAFGHDDDFGQVVDFEYAMMNRRYDEALQIAQSMRSKTDYYYRLSQVHARLGDYQQALDFQKRYMTIRDSVNSAEVRKGTSELSVALEAARAKMEAQRQRERTQRVLMLMVGVIALIIIAFLAFYLYRHKKHEKEMEAAYDKLESAHGKLESAHKELEKAYRQIEETTKAKERIESELRIARDIQMDMVPSTFPAFPERQDIDLHAMMIPAKEVGGDLYDFFLQNDHLYFCIGDVAGKGIPASLFMSVVVNIFRMVAKEGFPPAYVATKLNEALSSENETGMFCTMFIGEIDLRTGRLNYCNAGHNAPLIVDRPLSPHEPSRPSFLEMETNAPIGLWPNLEFVGEHIDSLRGRTLFIYTDGLTEAENLSQEQFGEERLFRLFETRPYETARQSIDIVKASVAAFVGEAEPSDDQTMLCIKIK